VEAVVAEVLGSDPVRSGFRRALDPACGDGRFVRATRLAEQTGVDIDPGVEPGDGVRFICADALARDWGSELFDVVVGNPPFLSQMSSLTTRGGRSRFGGGAYANAAAEFLALAVRLTRPGGRVGMVLPQSLLASRDAEGIREFVDAHASLRWAWSTDANVFDARVRVWAGVWEVGGARTEVRRALDLPMREVDPVAPPPSRSWAPLLTGVAVPDTAAGPRLGDIATFTANFRDQYYGLVGAVGDHDDGPPLVTSGLIDPRRCLWGDKPVTFARQSYARPRVRLDSLSPAMRRWADVKLVPKILIANQTRRVEAVVDERGEWLPSVPVITCVTSEPDRVMAVLESERTEAWLRAHAAGTGLSATALRLRPGLLADVPLG
jgi:hypothetical protein